MKEGAYIGAVVAFFIYMLLPIYGENGAPASVIPTGHAVSGTTGFSTYLSNLPLSMILFFGLEVLGISTGIASQMVLRKVYKAHE